MTPHRLARPSRVAKWIDQVRLDSLYGLRQLLIHRGFTGVAVVTLALGIGVNTAMFSVVRSLLTGASRFPDSDRLVMIQATTADRHSVGVTAADAEELRHRSEMFSQVAAMAWLLSAMAGFALSLSVVGLYGLMSQLVIQRTREIGVRLAVGATPADIGRMVLLRSSRLAATGLVIGAVVSVPVGMAVATQLYGVGGADPRSFALVAALLLAAGVLAGYLPARRAARIDPIATLRCE